MGMLHSLGNGRIISLRRWIARGVGGILHQHSLFFAIFDGHNGIAAEVFSRDHLLNHVLLSSLSRGLGWDEWLQALPRALVTGFVKTDNELQNREWRMVPTPLRPTSNTADL